MSTTLQPSPAGENLLRALERENHSNLYACYQCGKCTAACPFGLSPQRVMRHLQLAQVELALSAETTWVCASCLTCSRLCPRDADPAGVMRTLRAVRSGPLAGEPDGNGEGQARRDLTHLAAEQHDRHHHALRAFFFANIHEISRHGSRLAPLANRAGHLPGSRLVAHYLLGIHKDRPLPVFARPSFPEWFALRPSPARGTRGDVLLFHDTFMDYDVPQVGVAATELLERAGYRVVLTDNVCCGRPMISKGYIDRARTQARLNVSRLRAQLREDAWIVGCEPSCLLTIREEYPRLLAGTDLQGPARELAERCLLIDEFLADSRRASDLWPNAVEASGREVLFHGHCQQKAEADAELSLGLLRAAGYRAEMVRAPCCGMAGAFGFEREHYEASREAFGRALGPALEARPDACLAIMGVSCRKQIEHLAGRRAFHVVELLREAAGELDAD